MGNYGNQNDIFAERNQSQDNQLDLQNINRQNKYFKSIVDEDLSRNNKSQTFKNKSNIFNSSIQKYNGENLSKANDEYVYDYDPNKPLTFSQKFQILE